MMWNRLRLLTAAFALLSAITNAQESAPPVAKALLDAAERGSPVAQYAVGAAFEKQGDIRSATQWYLKAADAGFGGAEFKLGEIIEKGLYEGHTSREAAARWYALAAEHGIDAARDALARLSAESETAKPAAGTPDAPASAETAAAAVALSPERVNAEEPQSAVQTPRASDTAAAAISGTPVEQIAVVDADSTTNSSSSYTVILESALVFYFFVSWYAGWKLMRPVLIGWYLGQTWYVSGRNAKEVLLAQIGNRLQIEFFAITLGMLVGNLGGNLYYFLVARRQQSAAPEAE